jgi:hypothetical protein
LNNVRYDSINILENKLIFSVTINSVKYTAATNQNFDILNVWDPISIEDWIKESCPSYVRLPEASASIKAMAQQKISNWLYKNKNFFDTFYSYDSIKSSKNLFKNVN